MNQDGINQWCRRNGFPYVEEIKNIARAWIKGILAAGRGMLIKTAVVAVLFFDFLYFLRWLWIVYSNTQIGRKFAQELNPELAGNIGDLLLRHDFWALTLNLIAGVLTAGLLVGVIAQFLFLKRYLFDARGIVMKLFWATGISLLVAQNQALPLLPATFALILSVLLALMLQNCIFDLAGRLLPECNIPALVNRIRSAREISAIRDRVG